MRFICLHGKGTNNKVFEAQTAAIRYGLGQAHSYEFVEGVVGAEMNADIRHIFPTTDDYFEYFNPDDSTSILKAIRDLESFITTEGPFDGVIAFSQGAAVAATLMVQRRRRNGAAELVSPVFKCAAFFGAAVDAILMNSSMVEFGN